MTTLPPLIFIKALILQGFFVPMCFWSPIWSSIISLAFAGLQRIVMDVLFSWRLRAITSVVVLDLTDAGAAAKVRKESGYEQGKADKRESRASSRAKK